MTHKKTLFICDAHLGTGENQAQREQVLIEFLRGLAPERVSTLYILGDLFDFWFEYKSVVHSQHFRVLTELAQAVERGIEIHLIVGNHDFWAGDFLKNMIGMMIHYDPIEIDLDGLHVYMCHGDGLNPYDRGYTILKAIIRSRPVIWTVRKMHPEWILMFARWFSKFSRESTSIAGNLREDEGVRNFALKKLHEAVDVVIAGHSHQPHDEEHSINGSIRRYYNVGDMQRHFSYLEYRRGVFQLKYLDTESMRA